MYQTAHSTQHLIFAPVACSPMRAQYYEEQFAQNSRNSKRTWKLINDIFGKTKASSFPQRLKVDGRVYSSTKLILQKVVSWFLDSDDNPDSHQNVIITNTTKSNLPKTAETLKELGN